MAATIAFAVGRDKRGEGTAVKECSRLGSESAEARAQTFKTFTICGVKADGSGYVRIERVIDGKRVALASISFDAEEGTNADTTYIAARNGFTGEHHVESQMTDSSFDMATNGGQF